MKDGTLLTTIDVNNGFEKDNNVHIGAQSSSRVVLCVSNPHNATAVYMSLDETIEVIAQLQEFVDASIAETYEKLKFKPDWTSPPGETISDLMEEQKFSRDRVSGALGLRNADLDNLLKGTYPITATIAIRLQKLFRLSASFWMKREAFYRLDLKRLGGG